LPETTKVLFFLFCAVFTIIGGALVPFSWVTLRGTGFLPERITNTRWFRGAMRVSVTVFLLVVAYGVIFLGWNLRG
jgi:hypothetical protein